ncbi:MAG: nucleotide exchange factor GrpE [Oscillospiraceae bacterium]|nr:nucleotide exchange factor GrpE [Oscillospiraceae bacterium]
MSKKKQTEAEEVKEEKTEEAPEETIKEEETKAPETEEKPADEKAEKTKEAKPKTDELAAERDKYLRLCAEYDNFRKRSQKEKDAIYADVRASTLTSFLPVYDNLVRALNQPTEDEAYKKGVEMIMTQFKTTMEKLGVTEMDCLGKKFDPAFHNAVMHVDDEEKGENEIVEVFQQGFMLGDKVVRFAMVKVAN